MIHVKVDQLTKKYNRNLVFQGISFEHSSGVLGVSGTNGSGKSTLLKCMAGLHRPDSGSVTWTDDGKTLSKDAFSNSIGYAAPYINLYDDLTVFENLEFLCKVSRTNKNSAEIEELLSYTEISHLKESYFKSLSTGQQQRVKLAASLIRSPKILFLDEPGSNLDTHGHKLVQRIVSDWKEKNTLVVLASNDPDEIALCDNVFHLSK